LGRANGICNRAKNALRCAGAAPAWITPLCGLGAARAAHNGAFALRILHTRFLDYTTLCIWFICYFSPYAGIYTCLSPNLTPPPPFALVCFFLPWWEDGQLSPSEPLHCAGTPPAWVGPRDWFGFWDQYRLSSTAPDGARQHLSHSLLPTHSVPFPITPRRATPTLTTDPATTLADYHRLSDIAGNTLSPPSPPHLSPRDSILLVRTARHCLEPY